MKADGDELLEYYRGELTYLRRMGAEFARRYPKVAGRLELGADECGDPHVERLLEAFAFLAARIQFNLESQLPEVSSALLGILHPQYLSPLPALAMAQFDVDPTQGKLTSGHHIKRGTPLFAESTEGHICRFRTCYDVTLWPVKVEYAGLESVDRFDFLAGAANVAAVLRLKLRAEGIGFEDLQLERLRLHLHGERRTVNALYELLFCHVVRVAVRSKGRPDPSFLPADSIHPVGFEEDEEALPRPSRVHPGYRLLQEYFAFPEKFLFFELENLHRLARGSECDVLFMLDRLPPPRMVVSHSSFRLGCTPIVNLFRKTSEPIRLDHRLGEYRLVPDVRRERTTEVHSILRVSATENPEDDLKSYEPFYSFNHHLEARGQRAFWHMRRVPTARAGVPGTDVYLRFVDLDFRPSAPPAQTVYAHTLCTNRDLAERIPGGARLQIEEAAPLQRISCLGRPTPQVQPPLGGATLWRLISHLSTSYLSLSEGVDSLKALREILRLSSLADEAGAHQQIQGIRELHSRRVVRHIGHGALVSLGRGLEVTVILDEEAFVGHSAFLMAAVLNRFLASYVTVNSFTELVLRTKQRPGIWKRWPPMAGDRVIL